MRQRLGGAGRSGGLVGALVAAIGLLGASLPAPAQAVTDPGTVVHTTDTSLWNPPSPDPSGITWRPDTQRLVTCDAEVEEVVNGITHYHGVNVWTHTTAGVVTSTQDTLWFSSEPTGCYYDPAGNRLFFSDDVKFWLYELHFGPDGIYGTPDDTRTQLKGYKALGCGDMEDVTLDSLSGSLYVAGGDFGVCKISPGPNGRFDGAPSFGDDTVQILPLQQLGIIDVEGVVYDPFWDTLVVADRATRALYEITPQGNLLRKIAVNWPSDVKPAGVTIAPGTTNPVLRNYYVADRHVDNNDNPNEVDGRIFEVVAIPLGGNAAPIVDAGPPQTLQCPTNAANLSGYVSDDGHPYPPSTVTAVWSKQSGPGSVSFGNSNQPVTTATFSDPGDYVLQLVGNDSQRTTTDTVEITISQTVTLSVTTSGPGSVTLDPPGGSYTYGQNVTVTAVPDPGAGFTGFGGGLSGTTNPQALLMDGSKTVTASFATLVHLDATAQGPGGITLAPPGGSYLPGTQVTVTAVPSANAVFTMWGGALSGTTNPEMITVASDTSVTATFTQLYTVMTAAVGPGSVSLGAPGPYASGTQLSVTAIPDAGAVFVGWSGALSGATNPESLLVDSDKSVTATFAAFYGVSVQTSGPGSVTLNPPGGSYAPGSVVEVTATPDPGAVFGGFSGDLTGTTNPQLLTVDSNKTVGASFARLFTLSVIPTGPGSVTLNPPGGSYSAGTDVEVTATPDPFAVFLGFGGDLSGTTSPQNLTVDADKSVTASFDLPSYALTLTQQGLGTVTVDPPTGPYPAGSTVTLTAEPRTGWRFGGWSGDVAGADNPLLLLMNGDKAVHAAFSSGGGGLPACGIGPELAALIPVLGWLHRRRRGR